MSAKEEVETAVPRDVRLLHLILAAQGIQQYQDQVPLQLMDFAYRYTTAVLKDAALYSDHAHATINNAGNPGANVPLTTDDVRLAIAARTNYQFKPTPPKELLLELAAERNKTKLPPPVATWGLQLPPEKYCLNGKDWSLSDEEFDEENAKRQKV